MRRKLPAFLLFFLFLGSCQEKTELSVTKLHPTRGPYMGGDPVTITGSGFKPQLGITIYFGKNKAKPPVIKENGEIVVEPPAGEIGQTVDVEIVFDDARTLKLPQAYSYFDPTDLKKTPQ
jgi:IPT/TIG domain-containing protein